MRTCRKRQIFGRTELTQESVLVQFEGNTLKQNEGRTMPDQANTHAFAEALFCNTVFASK
jgi:hypothetical protein